MNATVDPDQHERPGALSPAAVLEVLAYLVTAARTQVDEAAEYGPMRLLTAAQRIAEHLPESTASAGPAVGGLVGELGRQQAPLPTLIVTVCPPVTGIVPVSAAP